MATELSTNLAAAMLRGEPFDELMRDGVIDLYTGAQPASADQPATGTALGRITRNGEAWTPGNPTGGLRLILDQNSAMKQPDQVWEFVANNANGVAGWFRWRGNAVGSTINIDGAIGQLDDQGDFQLFMANRTITPATRLNINDWWFTVPPLGVPA